MAKDMSKKVPGMEAYYDNYVARLSASDRKTINRFGVLCQQAYADLAEMLAKDSSGDGR